MVRALRLIVTGYQKELKEILNLNSNTHTHKKKFYTEGRIRLPLATTTTAKRICKNFVFVFYILRKKIVAI